MRRSPLPPKKKIKRFVQKTCFIHTYSSATDRAMSFIIIHDEVLDKAKSEGRDTRLALESYLSRHTRDEVTINTNTSIVFRQKSASSTASTRVRHFPLFQSSYKKLPLNKEDQEKELARARSRILAKASRESWTEERIQRELDQAPSRVPSIKRYPPYAFSSDVVLRALGMTETLWQDIYDALEAKKDGGSKIPIKQVYTGDKWTSIDLAEEFVDLVTLSMAEAQRWLLTNHNIPFTLYLRPRALWTKDARPSIGKGDTSLTMVFSRMFQWDLVPSPNIPEAYILMAVVTSWTATSIPPTCSGFWTYLTRDGQPQKISSEELYMQENAYAEARARTISFDPKGTFHNENFSVSVSSYNHLAPGEFISLLASAEAHPIHYGSTTLDDYAGTYYSALKTQDPDTFTDLNFLRLFLFSRKPLVNISMLQSIGSPESIEYLESNPLSYVSMYCNPVTTSTIRALT